MIRRPVWPRQLLALSLLAALAGCTAVTRSLPGRSRDGAREDCSRLLAMASAALAAPADSGAAPPAHDHAMKMHEYHACLAAASASRAPSPSRITP